MCATRVARTQPDQIASAHVAAKITATHTQFKIFYAGVYNTSATRKMNREQWQNLWRSFRWMKRRAGEDRAFAWVCGIDRRNYPIFKRLI